MYCEKFKFRFNEEVPDKDRMINMSELFGLPQYLKSIYWYNIRANGVVTFYTSLPETTDLVKCWVYDKENMNILTSIKPKISKDEIEFIRK